MKPWHLGHHLANPYFAFTDLCNDDRVRVVLASGQACVWYRLSLASKDGDWIIRESNEVCQAVLQRLSEMGAHYRLGAPLDPRWLAAGWSSHFEAGDSGGQRLRFDFVSRPPRITAKRLASLWEHLDTGVQAVIPPEDLIPLKQTMRLKDYPFIGALALKLANPADRVRWTLEPESLIQLLDQYPELAARLDELRPACEGVARTSEAFGVAIDGEIRRLRSLDELRIKAYSKAQQAWVETFRTMNLKGMSLSEEHAALSFAAEGILPQEQPC